MNNNTATTTRTIHVVCKADGTPIMLAPTCTAQRNALPTPLCFNSYKHAAGTLASRRWYGATQVISITWEVK